MENIIQQLKDNEKPFGLMSEEMRKRMRELAANSVLEFWNDHEWDCAMMPSFKGSTTYRLRADYEEKPEINECEISVGRNGTLSYDRDDGITSCSLGSASSYPDFIGFKFEDGTVMGSPVKYSVPGMTSKGYYTSYEDIKTGQALEHHATHVLFRRKKKE